MFVQYYTRPHTGSLHKHARNVHSCIAMVTVHSWILTNPLVWVKSEILLYPATEYNVVLGNMCWPLCSGWRRAWHSKHLATDCWHLLPHLWTLLRRGRWVVWKKEVRWKGWKVVALRSLVCLGGGGEWAWKRRERRRLQRKCSLTSGKRESRDGERMRSLRGKNFVSKLSTLSGESVVQALQYVWRECCIMFTAWVARVPYSLYSVSCKRTVYSYSCYVYTFEWSCRQWHCTHRVVCNCPCDSGLVAEAKERDSIQCMHGLADMACLVMYNGFYCVLGINVRTF